jgi:hypothetical protein
MSRGRQGKKGGGRQQSFYLAGNNKLIDAEFFLKMAVHLCSYSSSTESGSSAPFIGDVVAQLSPLADTRLPRRSSGFDPGFPHSLLRGGKNHDCITK